MFLRNISSPKARLVLTLVSLVLLSGCESGHVVEVRVMEEPTTSTESQLVDVFSVVSSNLGRYVSGPMTGPGRDVRYVAHPQEPTTDRSYDLYMMFLRGRKSIYIRTTATQAPRDWANRPLVTIRNTLDSMGITYRVKEN